MPDDAEEERAGTVHDCYVRKFPIPIVGYERFDYKGEERVVGDGAHGVVGDAGGIRAADPGWVGKKRVEAAVATIVEVDVDTAIMGEYEVSYSVCTLYRLGIIVEGV